jgi:hypothetical protein
MSESSKYVTERSALIPVPTVHNMHGEPIDMPAFPFQENVEVLPQRFQIELTDLQNEEIKQRF